jgi:hypothetical protein
LMEYRRFWSQTNQVKVRGYPVEPGEIRRHSANILSERNRVGLVLVSRRRNSSLCPDSRFWLRPVTYVLHFSQSFDYMIPSAFVFLKALINTYCKVIVQNCLLDDSSHRRTRIP